MATQLASIGVGKLSSTAKYVDTFIVEIYSDSGYTVKIGQQTSTAQWNGSAWVQKDSIIFGGLVFGTTYYLRAAVIAPLTGALSAWTTFNTAAGSASAPGCTYSGTFTATTSGIGYIVTPATVPTDIDHFEAVWVWDSSTPASTTSSYWTGQITNGNITFFVGGKPGDTAKVYVRAVNTSQQAQAWQLIDTRAVSTTWSGTTIGTIGDGTLLGTGGPSVNSGSTGKVGLGGSPVSDNLLTTFGSGRMGPSGTAPFFRMNDTGTSGRNYGLLDGSGVFHQYDETASTSRANFNSSGQYGINGSPSNKLSVFGGSDDGLLISNPEPSVFYADTTVGSRQYQQYGLSNNFSVWDNTATSNRLILNSSGQYGVGMTPSGTQQIDSTGSYIANRNAGNAGYWSYDTSASPATFVTITNRGSGGYFIQDNGAGINRTQINMSGQYGIGGSPSDIFDAFGATGSIQGAAAQIRVRDTNASGVDGNLTSGTTTAGTVYLYRNASPVQFLTSTGVGIGGTPSSQLYMTGGNGTFQTAIPALTFADTSVSGRSYGWQSGSAELQSYDGGTIRTHLNSSGQLGVGISPSSPFEANGGIVSRNSGAALFSADRTSGLLHAFYADAGYARINNPTGGDVVTINRSTGNLGIGGTFTGDWISVQGTSILDGSKVVAGGVRGYRYAAGSSASWVKLGTWTFNNAGTGRSIHVDVVSANGYNSGSAQQAHIELIARSGNASAAPNISGGSYYGRGGSTPITGFKIVAVGGSTAVNNGAWELWVNAAAFADMIVSPTVDSGDTFVWSGTSGADPGAASSSIVVGTGGMVMNAGGSGLDAINEGATYQRKRPASPRAVDTPYNSDFEIWSDNLTVGDGWTLAFEGTGSGSTISICTGFFGNFGQSIASTVGNGGSVASRPVPVRPNTKYELSARYISSVATTQGVFIRINWYSSDSAFDSASRITFSDTISNGAATTSWQFAANTFTSPSTAKYAVVAVYNFLPNVNATFTYDSVNIRTADVAQVDVGVDASGNLLFKNLNNASASTSSATQSSNVYAVVPEMSVTITTKGNKVLLNFSGSFSMNATGTPCFFAIFRDGTQISPEFQQTPANVLIFTQACTFIDTGASATSHTFDVRWRTTGGGNTISVAGTNRAFQVVELG